MTRIAGKVPGPAKLLSTTRRLTRLLDYPAIRVQERHEPIPRQWLEAQFRNLVERTDRRDLSIFLTSLRYIESLLTNAIPFQISLGFFR